MFLLQESQFQHEVGFNIDNHSSDSILTEPFLILSYKPESKIQSNSGASPSGYLGNSQCV